MAAVGQLLAPNTCYQFCKPKLANIHHQCSYFSEIWSLSEMVWMRGLGHCSAMKQPPRKSKPCIGRADTWQILSMDLDIVLPPFLLRKYTENFSELKFKWEHLNPKWFVKCISVPSVSQKVETLHTDQIYISDYREQTLLRNGEKNPPLSQTYIVLLQMALFLLNKSCLATYLQSK